MAFIGFLVSFDTSAFDRLLESKVFPFQFLLHPFTLALLNLSCTFSDEHVTVVCYNYSKSQKLKTLSTLSITYLQHMYLKRGREEQDKN